MYQMDGSEILFNTEKTDSGLRAIKNQENTSRASLYPSPGFGEWLYKISGSIVFSTYQTGRLYVLSGGPSGTMHAMERVVGTAMGLHIDGDKLWVASREQVWRFANVGPGNVDGVDHDAIYMPRAGWFIGDSDAHDVVADGTWKGQRCTLAFANTRFSCLSAIDDHYTFRPLWAPPFITELGPGDRCHLNGICAQDGELAFATICAETNESLGWRNRERIGRGIIMDMRTNEIVCRGLTMPHSPRWHDGKLWVLDGGTATLGYVDFSTQSLVPVATVPGFARGMAFAGGHIIVALSLLRHISPGIDFGLREILEERRVQQICGLAVIDPVSGQTVQWLRIEGGVTELYDVAFAPGIRRAWSPGFREPALHKVLMIAPDMGLPAKLRLPLTEPLPTAARLAALREKHAENMMQTNNTIPDSATIAVAGADNAMMDTGE